MVKKSYPLPVKEKAMIVQEVSRVKIAAEPELEYSSKLAFESLLGAKIEACSHYGDRVVPSEYHPFVAAVHSAYAEHRPLVLSPDMFWLLVAQGFANHVNVNAEAMRHHFVQFEGKKKVVIRRDQFIKGSPENDWARCLQRVRRQARRVHRQGEPRPHRLPVQHHGARRAGGERPGSHGRDAVLLRARHVSRCAASLASRWRAPPRTGRSSTTRPRNSARRMT